MRLVCAVLAAAILLTSSADVLASGAAWAKKRVGVYDYSSPAWRPIVEATVAEFNALLPARAPHLVYHPMSDAPCSQISSKMRRGGVTVCSVPSLPSTAELGLTQLSVKQGQLSRVRISLSEASNPNVRDTIVCHEFMHATTAIPDHYGARPTTSCVWGTLTTPGSFDAQYARKLYKHQDKGTARGGTHHHGRH